MSTKSTIGNFQISTDQVSPPNPNTAGENGKTFQIGNDQIRIDALGKSRHHIRAQQLNEFTSWLNQDCATTDQPQADTDNQQSSQVQPTTIIQNQKPKARFRVDPPTNKVRSHSSPSLNKPHFDSRNYTPDPDEINRIVAELKSDGRIIADLHQEPTTEKTSILRSSFQWPIVTTNLLGSPAILNLEMNVQQPVSGQCQKILVAGVQQGNGVTTVAMTLARQMATHGKRTLLVDANLTNSILAIRLGLKNHSSWVQAISERRSLLDTIISDPSSLVSVLPMIPISTRVGWPRKIFDQLAQIIESISAEYESIVFDVGTTTQLSNEVSTANNFGDTTLLVTGQKTVVQDEIYSAQSNLIKAGFSNLLIVENFSKMRRSRVG